MLECPSLPFCSKSGLSGWDFLICLTVLTPPPFVCCCALSFFRGTQTGHGLQKYPSTRHRIAVTIKNAAGETKYVLFATKGLPRPDGRINGTYC